MAHGSSFIHGMSSGGRTEGLFEELKDVQRQEGYLSPQKLAKIAKRRSMHVAEVHAVASYYPHFHLKPAAVVSLGLCTDMACRLRGGLELQQALEQRFHGRPEKEISIRPMSCPGRCDRAPLVSLNGVYREEASASSLFQIVEQALAEKTVPQAAPEVWKKPGRLASDPYDGEKSYAILKRLVNSRSQSKDFSSVIETLKAAGLRGMGGAGFPAATKWALARASRSDTKYVICNADESEPGTIKDRFILTHSPHLVIEAMIIAGLVIGAKTGIIYIRHEYAQQSRMLRAEIEVLRRQGILGNSVLGSEFAFDLSVFDSPGGYICGEASALLEALEGKRAEPRNKPPQATTHGLWGKPTLLSNTETFLFATTILGRGAEWWKKQGVNGASGLKFVGITGHVNNPGVFEVPFGTSYGDLINNYAGGVLEGKRLLAFAPSGPSSGYFPASMASLPMEWDAMTKAGSMVGSAAVVVCAEGTCMLQMALNSVTFFRNESCGKCVPCRVGSQKLVEMITGWTHGAGSNSDGELLDELSHCLRTSSICGLGQVVPAPIQSVLRYFRNDVEDHLEKKRCPAGVCFNKERTQ